MKMRFRDPRPRDPVSSRWFQRGGSGSDMKRRRVIGLLVVAVGAAGLVWWPFFQVLEITDLNRGSVVLCARMADREEFVVSFTHSVNRRPVYDTLRADGGRLVIGKSRFDHFGAGMPDASTADGTLKVLEDGWLEYTVNRPVAEVTVRVGRVADHRLNLKGRDIPLAKLAPPGSPLSFQVRNTHLFDVMKGRCTW